MTRNAITDRYLDMIARRGVAADEIPAAVRSAADLHPTTFKGTCLSRPAFLDAGERERLEEDLGRLYTAVASLPDRLFGGDLAAFARAAGMTDTQVTAIMRGHTSTPSRLARGDIYHDGTNFRLMELNMGSTVGGLDNAVVNRAALTHPVLAEFVEAEGLAYVDTMKELAGMLLAESGVEPGARGVPDGPGARGVPDGSGERPLIAAVDWPASFATLEPQLHASAAMLAELGVEVVPCHLGQLDHRDGRLWLDGRAVDVVYRIWMIEDLLQPGGPELIDPVLRAVERGQVAIFTPMDTELYGSKAALAMLSDEANRHLHTAQELASLDRLLPWTRMVRDGAVTVDGETVDMLEYALGRREDLVLKPTMMHGSQGVVMGWLVDEDAWATQLRAAVDGPYVLQRRIQPAAEPFPADGGADDGAGGGAGDGAGDGLAAMRLAWCVFQVSSGFGGALVRGSTRSDGGLMDHAAGAQLGCCFHEQGRQASA